VTRAAQPAPAPVTAPVRGLVLTAIYVAIVLIWGTTWYAMKVSVESLPPLTAAGLRFVCAFPFLLLGVWLVPGWRLLPPPGTRWLVGVLTVSYIAVPYALINYGEQRTSSGLAAILFASVTVLLVVLSVLFGTVRVTVPQWLAIAVGLGLLALLVVSSHQSLGVTSAAGPLAIFTAAVLHALSYALIARYGRDVDVISLEVLPIGLGGLLLLALGGVAERPDLAQVTGRSWLAVGYLAGIASVIGFALYFYLLQRVSPVLVSFVFVFFPVVALALSVALEGVRVSPPMALAVLGVLVAFAVAKSTGTAAPDAIPAPVSPPTGGREPERAVPGHLLAQVAVEAVRAFPRECCGFVLDDRIRPAENVADRTRASDGSAWHRTAATGYVLSPADIRYLDDSLDGADPVRTLYHSHPNGRAYFSAEDLAHALVDGAPVFPAVRHLVLGVTADGVQEARLFDLGGGSAEEVQHWDRAALLAASGLRPAAPDSPDAARDASLQPR
jgi:drug/metabolite transporter (DMT)-like permease/proteasome lid subunit RPN8/RPN11